MTSPQVTRPAQPEHQGFVALQLARLARLPLSWRLALLYLPAIALAEVLTILVESWLGVALHGLILIVLLVHAALETRRIRRFLMALAMAPLIRLVSLALPLRNLPLVYWYLVVGVLLFVAAFYTARAGRLNRKMIGLTGRKLPFQLLVGLTGIALGYLEYQILRPQPLVAGLRWELLVVPALILLVFTGLLEELIFRGMLQYTSLPTLGRAGLLYTALVFTVLHLGYRSWLDLVFVFGVAMFFGWAVQRSGSILGATLSHGLTNIGLFLVFPFLLAAPPPPVSEPQVAATVAPLVETQAAEPAPPVLLAPAENVPTAGPGPSLLLLAGTPQSTPTATVTITATPTPTPCGPPSGWVQYQVQPGERMLTLSEKFGVSRAQLRLANCLDSNRLSAGQILWVPFLPVTPISPPPPVVWPTLPPPPPVPAPTNEPIIPPVPTDMVWPTDTGTPPPAPTQPAWPTDTPPVVWPTDTPFPTDTPPPTDPPPPPTDTPPAALPTDTPPPTDAPPVPSTPASTEQPPAAETLSP